MPVISISQAVLNKVTSNTYSGGVMHDASGASRYLFVSRSAWVEGGSGLSMSQATYDLIHGATAITSGPNAGCFTIASGGAVKQLVVNAGWCEPSDPPSPP